MLRRSLKLLHELGAIGVMGSYASCLVLVATSPPSRSLAAYAAVRQAIAAISHWLLVPSLALVVVSGLLAIAANKAYLDAGWAWFKAALGLGMFEGTLLTVAGSARRAAELSALAVNGQPDPNALAQVLHAERGGLCLLLVLSLANVVLAVWRPRFRPVNPA